MKNQQIVRTLIILGFSLLMSSYAYGQKEMGNACKFDKGPRAGETQDYSDLPALPVGSPCQDGQTPVSTGKVVNTKPDKEMGNACKFDKGPRAGETQDYSELPPLPVGSPCQDGKSPVSSGKVVNTKKVG